MASQATFSVFKKADMEGYLEKVSSGIASKLKASKTKVWCELSDTTLHIFKESKRSSTRDQIDMTQVHVVRRSNADKAGQQFEILGRNKAQVFVAPSAEECNVWVKCLQHSMTLKSQGEATGVNLRKMSQGDYEVIAVSSENQAANPQLQIRESNASESGYAEVEFQKAPTALKSSTIESQKIPQNDQKANVSSNRITETLETVSTEGGYSTVEVVRRSPATQPTPNRDTDEYGYSKVKVQMDLDLQNQTQPEVLDPSRPETEGREHDSYCYATVSRNNKSSILPEQNMSQFTGDGASDEDEDGGYVSLLADGNFHPIPHFPHPLGPTDTEPLAALKRFLSNNSKVCRHSFFDKTPTVDPVGDLAKLLISLQCSHVF